MMNNLSYRTVDLDFFFWTNIYANVEILISNLLINKTYSILFCAVIYLGNSSILYKNMQYLSHFGTRKILLNVQ